jgi:hypothetical protein
MQPLLWCAVWDADLVRDDVHEHVLTELGKQEAIGVIDETSFLKRGGQIGRGCRAVLWKHWRGPKLSGGRVFGAYLQIY